MLMAIKMVVNQLQVAQIHLRFMHLAPQVAPHLVAQRPLLRQLQPLPARMLLQQLRLQHKLPQLMSQQLLNQLAK